MQEFTRCSPVNLTAGKLPIEAQGKFDARREKGDSKAPQFGGEGMGGKSQVEAGLCYALNGCGSKWKTVKGTTDVNV